MKKLLKFTIIIILRIAWVILLFALPLIVIVMGITQKDNYLFSMGIIGLIINLHTVHIGKLFDLQRATDDTLASLEQEVAELKETLTGRETDE